MNDSSAYNVSGASLRCDYSHATPLACVRISEKRALGITFLKNKLLWDNVRQNFEKSAQFISVQLREFSETKKTQVKPEKVTSAPAASLGPLPVTSPQGRPGNRHPDFQHCVLCGPFPELQKNGFTLPYAPACFVSTLFNISFVWFIHVIV